MSTTTGWMLELPQGLRGELPLYYQGFVVPESDSIPATTPHWGCATFFVSRDEAEEFRDCTSYLADFVAVEHGFDGVAPIPHQCCAGGCGLYRTEAPTDA